MPNVEIIEIPGVPDQTFFQLSFPNLYHLVVQANYDHCDFIANLASSELLHQISLDYTDCLNAESREDEEDPELQAYNAEVKAEEEKRKVELEKLIATGLSKKEAERVQERRLLEEGGLTKEEIAWELDNPNREESLRLLTIMMNEDADEEDTPEEINEMIEETMTFYDKLGRWDENGEPNPDYGTEYEIMEVEESPSWNKRTPFEDYKKLFKAIKKGSNMHIKLRESYLTKEELKEIAQINKTVQFLHIPTEWGNYIK